MEEKKYVYVVTTGINGVDDREEVGRFDNFEEAIEFMEHRKNLLDIEARIESQQAYYRNDKEFTQFDIQIDEEVLDEDDYIIDADLLTFKKTPKFRYGQIVD